MTRRTFTHTLALLAVVAAAAAVGCSRADQSDGWGDKPGTRVLTSFAPIQCFAMNVAGDDANVQVLFGDEGPHHIKETPAHLRMFGGADVLYVNGLKLETRNVAKMQKSTAKPVPLVDLGSKLPKEMLVVGSCNCCKEEEGQEEHDHEHDDVDPHVWLGIDHAVKMVEAIRDDLKERDPAHADGYTKRAADYVAKLNKLKADGQALLKDKAERQIVSFHDSLAYFAKTFGLKPPEVIQMVAGHEPTQKELNALMDRCVKKKVRVIAVEPQYGAGTSAKSVAKTLEAKGLADVQMIVVDPLETTATGEFNADWYETKMRANLDALAKALK